MKGDKVRVIFSDKPVEGIVVQELPTKPLKRRLRKTHVTQFFGSEYQVLTELQPMALMKNIKLRKNMSYDDAIKELNRAIDAAKKKIRAEMGKLAEDAEFRMQHQRSIEYHLEHELFIVEKDVYYLEVPPADAKDFKAKGKDFEIELSWTKWRALAPGSDMAPADGSDSYYMVYESSSPQSARKLFLLLKAKPNAVKSIPWTKLDGWLNRQKIKYSLHMSYLR